MNCKYVKLQSRILFRLWGFPKHAQFYCPLRFGFFLIFSYLRLRNKESIFGGHGNDTLVHPNSSNFLSWIHSPSQAQSAQLLVSIRGFWLQVQHDDGTFDGMDLVFVSNIQQFGTKLKTYIEILIWNFTLTSLRLIQHFL